MKKKKIGGEVDLDTIPVEIYDGLGSNIIKMMIRNTFNYKSLVRLKKNIPSEVRDEIPIFKSIKDYLKILIREKEIKLTKIGNLPTKYVKEIYENNQIKEHLIEELGYKLSSEKKSDGVQISRALAVICRYTKIKNNKLSITKIGEKALKNEATMFKNIIQVFTSDYNWGYFDGYQDDIDLSEVVSYQYYLIGKYGETIEKYSFYADKFLEAFPMVLDRIVEKNFFSTEKKYFEHMNFHRTFKVYMKLLGVVVCVDEWENCKVKKTNLFDKLIDLSPIYRMTKYNKEETKKNNLEGVIAMLKPSED